MLFQHTADKFSTNCASLLAYPESLKQNIYERGRCRTNLGDGKSLIFSRKLAFAAAAFRKTLPAIKHRSDSKPPRSCLPRLSASDPTMLERNRLQPPLSSAPSQTAGGFDGRLLGASGFFPSAEDYDTTGILAGVDLCESRYWWMPELYTSPDTSPVFDTGAVDTCSVTTTEGGDSERRPGVLERFLRAGQATRRRGSRTTAAA